MIVNGAMQPGFSGNNPDAGRFATSEEAPETMFSPYFLSTDVWAA